MWQVVNRCFLYINTEYTGIAEEEKWMEVKLPFDLLPLTSFEKGINFRVHKDKNIKAVN